MSENPQFKFIEFNPRRAMRGADAARVEVTEQGATDLLWMSKRDIKKNVVAFGSCEALQQAATAYEAWQ